MQTKKQKWEAEYRKKRRLDPEIKRREKNYRDKLRRNALIKVCNSDPPYCDCCNEQDVELLVIDHKHGGGKAHRKIIGGGKGTYYWIMKTPTSKVRKIMRILCIECHDIMGVKSTASRHRLVANYLDRLNR